MESPDGQSEQVGQVTNLNEDSMRSAGVGHDQTANRFAAETSFVHVEYEPQRWKNWIRIAPICDVFPRYTHHVSGSGFQAILSTSSAL